VPPIDPRAAKTYLQVNPDVDLLVLEARGSIGGTWSRDRVYDGLISHNAMGGFECSDLSMRDCGAVATAEGYVKGEDISMYLDTLVETYDLARRIRYDCRVHSISREQDETWKLDIEGAEESAYTCRKLIMACGLTSKPNFPDIRTTNPQVPIFHSIDLRVQQDFLRSDKVERVIIYGGSKSAFDAVFLCANAGKYVDWVIRPSGQSVACMFTGTSFGGIATAKLAPRRFLGSLSPCIYNSNTWYSRFLHGSKMGQTLVKFYWKTLTKIGYQKHRLYSTENGRKLIPELGELGSFWGGSTPAGVSSEPRFWDVLHKSGLITVHRAEINSITENRAALSTGDTLRPASAIVYCTGWIRNNVPFAPSLGLSLGVPVPISSVPEENKRRWGSLEDSAERIVLERFPMLSKPPPYHKIPRTVTPYRLYRLTAPPELAATGDHSIAFVGTMHTAATGMLSGIQALWAVAYLEGKLKLPELEEMDREVAEVNVWMRRRYLNLGEKCHNMTFEYLPYMDTLLQDLGIESCRKKGLLQRLLGEHTGADYNGVIEEWVQRERAKTKVEH